MSDAGDKGPGCNWHSAGESVTSYCFGGASDEERYQFEAHLIDCPHCWREVQRLDAIIQAIQKDRRATDRFDSDLVSMIGISSSFDRHMAGHHLHAFLASLLYALIAASAVFLEIAFHYDRFASLAWTGASIIFVWTMVSTLAVLTLDWRFTRTGRNSGLTLSVCLFTIAAVIQHVTFRPFLPSYPITEASFQTWTAQAAFLKDVVYAAAFTAVFLLVPFHFVLAIQRELSAGRHAIPLELLTGSKFAVSPRGAPYFRVWLLGGLLIFGAAYSIVSSAHLLEGLRITEYTNLFIHVLQIRWLLFLVLGLESSWWYYSAINELKRECNALHRLESHSS
jgi:hypothetical protein